jgi:hypothetical protein
VARALIEITLRKRFWVFYDRVKCMTEDELMDRVRHDPRLWRYDVMEAANVEFREVCLDAPASHWDDGLKDLRPSGV